MPQSINEGFPLSPQQKSLWDRQPEGEFRMSETSVTIPGPVDEQRLTAAVRSVVERNEILRTEFARSPGMKVPFQVVGSGKSVLDAQISGNQLILKAPALCADPLGMRNVAAQILAFYQNPELEPEEPLQYADYSEWQNQQLQPRNFPQIPDIRLPFENKTPAYFKSSQKIPVTVPGGFGPAEVLAGWMILLFRLSGQTEVMVGRVVSGRNHEEFTEAIGLFEKVIPESADLSGALRFRDLVQTLEHSQAEAEAQEDAFPSGSAPVPAIGFHFGPNIHNFKLCLHQTSEACWLSFDPAVFGLAAVEEIARRLEWLLAGAAQNPEGEVQALPLLSEGERRSVLAGANGPETEYPRHECVHHLFESHARSTPERPALKCGRQTLTFRELNERANRIAHDLRGRGVGPDVCVGLFVERSAEMIVGLLAILKAGGCYVPLVPDNPRTRLAHQLAETAAPVVLTQEKLMGGLPDFGGAVLALDLEQNFAHQPSSDPAPTAGPDNLVYVIYTSGSTGTPKGVAVRHRNLMNYSVFLAAKAGGQGLNFATVSTVAADLGNTAIFPSLLSGGCLHVIDYETALSPALFSDYMAASPVDVLKITPTHLASLLDGAAGAPVLPRTHLITGGEALRWELLDRVREASDCAVINHYGPTEATVGCCTYDASLAAPGDRAAATVPIGKPIANTQVYILDSRLEPAPPGVAGELCVAGEGVAAGYLNQKDQTEERFVSLSWLPEGARAYRTGDLARFLPDGNIEFLGRIDRQVKIRGFRVEPAEIVSALKAHPQVRDAVVLAERDEAGDLRLIACVVGPKTLSDGDLRAFLRLELPDYMVPAGFAVADAIPFTPNGKVDGAAVSALLSGRAQNAREFIGPRNPDEEKLAAMWCEVLRIDRVGVRDNFFDLGGHSLMATQVISRVRNVFRVQMPLIAFLETPTIEDLAAKLSTCPPLDEDSDEMARLLSELDSLSEEEAEALLAAEGEADSSPR